MSVITRVTLTTDTNGVSPTGFTTNSDAPTMFRKLETLVGAVAGGGQNGRMILAHAPIAAKATLTFAGNTSNADTLTIGGIAITFVTSGATAAAKQINLGTAGDGTDVATSVAAMVNGIANTRGYTGTPTAFEGICTATVSGAVVTLTAYLPGTMGNGLALAKSCANLTLTNAWGASVVGTEGTKATYKVGL